MFVYGHVEERVVGGIIGISLLGAAQFAFATPVGCAIVFTPNTATAGTYQGVTGTFTGTVVSGSFSNTFYVQPGANTFTLTTPSGSQCKGVVIGQ